MRTRGFLLLLAWAATVVGLGTAAAFAAEQVTFEVVDTDGIYLGSGKNPKSPGVLSADKVWAKIPEYKRIIDEELDQDDAEYHLLMKKATERFQKALQKLAKREGHDMLGEVGSIKVKGDKAKKIPDVTEDLIELVGRE